jgi:hypothetical protein
MPDRYSQINLAEIEDVAPANGFADRWQARVARTPLGAHLDGEERARAVGAVPRQQRADRGRVRLTEDQPADRRRVEIEAGTYLIRTLSIGLQQSISRPGGVGLGLRERRRRR